MSLRIIGALALVCVAVPACGGDDTSAPSDAGTAAGPTGGASSSGDADTQNPDPETGSSMGAADTDSPADSSSSSGDPPADSSSGGDTTGDTTGAAAPTWDNFGAGFFESYCWECHGAGDRQGRDYSELAGVLGELAPIRCGTGPASNPPPDCAGKLPAGQFPIGDNLPTDAEREALVQWIDAGAPEN